MLCAAVGARSGAASYPAPHDGTYVVPSFKFESGETLQNLRLHYITFGTPQTGRNGRTTNAVLIMHGTGGSTKQFLRPQFAGVLFVPGGLLDARKYYIIIPDGIGHGQSSKPSDGLRAKFPHYDYHDMVHAQHELIVNGLHVNHLRLVMGTSMGGMQSWMWGEMYPDMMDALMPLASLPVEISGRNRIWRQLHNRAAGDARGSGLALDGRQRPGLRSAPHADGHRSGCLFSFRGRSAAGTL
jgi:homoserine O-acetyltransferase